MKEIVFNEFALTELKKLCINNQKALELIKLVENNTYIIKRTKPSQKKQKEKVPYALIGKKIEEYAENFRTKLVDNQTVAEKEFKKYLKLLNVKFSFQRIVYFKNTFYIVDFYVPQLNIVFEIDGGYHTEEEQMKKDELRTQHLKSKGIEEIYRFTNDEVSDSATTIKRLTEILIKHN